MKKFVHIFFAIAIIWGGLFTSQAHAAIAFVASSSATCSSACSATTTAITTTGATLLVVDLGNLFTNANAAVISDTLGNTWASSTFCTYGGNPSGAIWYSWSKGGSALSTGSDQVHATNGDYHNVSFSAWSGTLTGSNPLDVSATTTRSSGDATVSSTLTTTAADLVITNDVNASGGTPNSINNGFKKIADLETGMSSLDAYLIQSVSGSTGATTWSTQASTNCMGMAAFKPAAGGGGGATVPAKWIWWGDD